MRARLSPVVLPNINMFASRVFRLTDYRKELSTYFQNKMALVAPNLATLIGDTVGARLISNAGSLTNTAKAPASMSRSWEQRRLCSEHTL